MAFQTGRIQIDGSLNVDGSIFQYGVEFTGGGGGTGDVAWASGNIGSNNQIITAAGDGSIVAESNLLFNTNTLYGQDNTGSGDPLVVRSGDSTSSGAGGSLTIRSGAASGSSFVGGDVSIYAGNSVGGSNGAALYISSGMSQGSDAGLLSIKGGYGGGSSGGKIEIFGGDGAGYGGDITIRPGQGAGGGGDVSINASGPTSPGPDSGEIFIGLTDTSALYIGNTGNITTGTPGSNQILYVDTADSNKLKRGTVTGGVTYAGGDVNNYLLTATGSDTIQGESNLTFNGTDLGLSGNMSITGTLDVSPGSVKIGGTDCRLEMSDTTGDSFRLQNQNGVFKIINGTDSDREDLIIDGDGNVGIQITPAVPFHAYHATNNSVARIESGDRFGIIEIKDSLATWSILVDGTDSLMRFTNAASGGGNSILTLWGTDRVGINDTTPSYELDVTGKTRSTEGFQTGNFEIVHNATSDSLDFNYIA